MCRLNIRKAIYIFAITAVSMQLFGCGGGGGGEAAPTSLVYSGNTNAAIITLDNAPTLVGNVLYGGETGTNIPVAVTLTEQTATRSAGAVVQSEISQNISQHIRDSIFKNNVSPPDLIVGVDFNEPLECDSGSGSLTGTLNDSTFTGTLTFTFINCLLDGITYNGTGTFRIDAFDWSYFEPTDVMMTFTLMSISSSEFTGSMSGTIRIQSIINTNTEKMTLNYVAKDNLTGKMYKFENMIITIVYNDFFTPTSMTETITGTPARAYDSIHGYVEVNTLTPLIYSSILLANPDIDGVMLFTGAEGASIRVTVLSGDHIQLELDIDGMPGYEVTRILLWSELALNSSTDIKDTDNDGMHDSWESDNGLDPLNGADAEQDADGDNFSNIKEYQSGTDPNDVSSSPPFADLSITKTDSMDPVVAGTTFSYELAVSNAGPDTAINVQVQDALPHGLNFVSATGTGWNCNNLNGTVSCSRNSIAVGVVPAITVVVDAPFTSYNVSNTAIVSSNTPDPNNSNDSATEVTAILLPAADLSITKTDSVDPVVAGTTFSYALAVSNAGPDTAVNVQVQDALPPGLNFVSATGTGWSCDNLSGTVSCTRSSIAVGGAPSITVVVDTLFTSDNVSNTASVSSNTADPNGSNDSATETTAILLPAASFNFNIGAPVFDMELDTARQLLYVSVPNLNEVVIVSLDSFTIFGRVVVGSSPHGMDISQDGNTLYIALNQGGAVAMLDLNTRLVSELVVAVELDTSLVYDVIAATPTEVFASGNPGSSGFSYIVKIDTANGNLVTRVASNRIIRANPFFVASADQQFLYVGEGFSPNSVYQLDLTQNDVPIVLEDNHGSISGSDHLSINPDGTRLFLTSGQVLRTDTLTQAGLIGRGVSIVSADGTKAYVGKAPNSISVYDTSTFLEIDNILTTCDITSIERIIELQTNTEWILLGQQTVCQVDLNSIP